MRVTLRRNRLVAAFAGAAMTLVASGAGLVVAPAAAVEDFTPFISEIHYDNDGTDVGEAIEVEAPVGFDLTGWKIVLYNGATPTAAVVYGTRTLSGTVPAAGVVVENYPSNGIQNGSNDGMALVNPTGQVVELLSYEGIFTASDGPAAGMTATDIGVQEGSGTPVGHSLQKIDGTWQGPLANTFGVRNGGNPDPDPVKRLAIAEIQGEGPASPYAGQEVTTTGLVTAVYPVGGFNGYYIQTPGTGGDADPTSRTASDGLFVYSPQTVASVRIGDHLEVTGKVSEFQGLTEITVSAAGFTKLTEVAVAVKPVPFHLPADEQVRERFEGMLVQPAGDYTVSDTYDLGGWGQNAYGSIILAAGDKPLRQPTDAAPPGPQAQKIAADNAARLVILDDGRSVQTSTSGLVPYLTKATPVRAGAAATFTSPVIFDYRFGAWRFQPTEPEPGGSSDDVAFENTRTESPESVGGDVRLATFNVLNYFTTLGTDLAGCTAYTDRQGNPLTVRGGCLARGAWDEANLARQEGKIVKAINSLAADVVALQEIENSAKFGKNRDDAVKNLVAALNADAGAATWNYIKSPATLPAVADEDVIRNAFIYRPANVAPVGESVILIGSPAFHNAREPLAQEFKELNGGERFLAVTNHFKSKGCSGATDPGDGQGCWTSDRVNQATALVEFAEDLADSRSIDKIFLMGDFNSYTQEDPMQVFSDAGFLNLNVEFAAEHTYVFGGQVGSLDHILGNAVAVGATTGVDVWNINSVESVLTEYSRYNYFASDLFEPATPYRASDHDPILVGLGIGPKCDRTITGTYDGALTITAGNTCLDGATVTGPVTVGEGAGLIANEATIIGPVNATDAAVVMVTDTRIDGPLWVVDTTNRVTVDGTSVDGPVTLNGNAGAVVADNNITGPLSCAGNDPAPGNDGRPNLVSGPKRGQCASL